MFPVKHDIDKDMFQVQSGQRFGLLVVEKTVDRKEPLDPRVLCKCDCGKTIILHGSNLVEKIKRSCGCIRIGAFGMSTTPIHHIWRSMRNRYYKKSAEPKVCARWGESFLEFRNDMGDFPGGCILARYNISKDFEPGNCYWKISSIGRSITWTSHK